MAVTNDEMIKWLRDFAHFFIEGTESYENLLEAADRLENQPTIEAVPLDALCEWLSVNCRKKISDLYCKFPAETWKQILTEWMEEQHDHN